MALFRKLLSLHGKITPEENFFTEVFVAVLNRNEGLLSEFLRRFLNYSEQYDSVRIESQVSFTRLPEHDMGSRPDVVIQIFTEEADVYDVVFIESKLGSSEGKNQLSRYADHLVEDFGGSRQRHLVYITSYFDPKESPMGVSDGRVKFAQIRWNQFYRLLKDFRQDALVDEMALFMEENGMAEETQLLPGDLFAMTAFSRLTDFMMNSLDGEVRAKFTSVLGVPPAPVKDMINNLRAHKRLMLFGYPTGEWWFGIGYFWHGNEYPTLGLIIEINARSSRWDEIARVLRQISLNPTAPGFAWGSYSLDQPQSWAGIHTGESLASIAQEPEHLNKIKDKFLGYLDQVAIIKNTYPSLPWVSVK